MNLPTVERHYLTREGDRVDQICWRYYGFTDIAVEAVYRRNGFLSYEHPILPALLLVILPVITEAELRLDREFWPTVERQLYTPGDATGTTAVADPDKKNTDGCCSDNPPVVDAADWLAVYVQNEKGDWVLRRMHKSKIGNVPYGYYGASAPSISTDLNDPTLFL